MEFINCNIDEFILLTKQKTVVCYGTVSYLQELCIRFKDYGLLHNIDYVIDDIAGGKTIDLDGIQKPFMTFKCFLAQNSEKDYAMFFSDLKSLVDFMRTDNIVPKNIMIFVGNFMAHNPPIYNLPESDLETGSSRIPKILHYCWFGGNDFPQLYKNCINSWKIFCPDYEIIEWNENNYDVTKNQFMYEAYQNKKWAFVSDFVRLDVVYNYGGCYLDSDVELIKPLDRFLFDVGFCDSYRPGEVGFAVFGAIAGHKLVRELRDIYDDMSFVNKDNTFNTKPAPEYLKQYFEKCGMSTENKVQKINDMTIYPTDVFSPLQANLRVLCFTEKTHAIHHYGWSWGSDERISKKYLDVIESRKFIQQFSATNIYDYPLPFEKPVTIK